MPWPAVGVVGGGEACTGGGEQADPPALDLAAGARRSEIEETRRPLD